MLYLAVWIGGGTQDYRNLCKLTHIRQYLDFQSNANSRESSKNLYNEKLTELKLKLETDPCLNECPEMIVR